MTETAVQIKKENLSVPLGASDTSHVGEMKKGDICTGTAGPTKDDPVPLGVSKETWLASAGTED